MLAARPRGFHLITRDIVAQMPEIGRFAVGLAHLFIRHTSASLALNENADPTVRADMEAYFNREVFFNPCDLCMHCLWPCLRLRHLAQ